MANIAYVSSTLVDLSWGEKVGEVSCSIGWDLDKQPEGKWHNHKCLFHKITTYLINFMIENTT